MIKKPSRMMWRAFGGASNDLQLVSALRRDVLLTSSSGPLLTRIPGGGLEPLTEEHPIAKLLVTSPEIALALADCIDSLEYVERVFPNASGTGVRQERIEAARAALKKAGVLSEESQT